MAAPAQPTLTPEYIEAYSGGQLIAVAIAFIPILLFFVGLRFYARHLSKTARGLDDWIVLASLIIQIGASAVAICFVQYGGVGRHFAALEQVDPGRPTVYYKYLLVVSFYYFFMVAIPKLAILALYLRLFTLRPYRITVYVLAAIVAATGIVCPIMSLNLCRPFEFNWNRMIPGGECWDEQAFYRWGSLPNVLTDIAMLVLPLPIVWRLHTSKKLKLGLTLTFLTGSVGLATSILRFTSFFHGSAVEDGTWGSVDLMTWTIIEPDVYLIAACLPTYRPLLVKILAKSKVSLTSMMPTRRTTYKTRDTNRSSQTPQVRTLDAHHGGIADGWHKFDDGKESLDGRSSDHIRLVDFGKEDLERQGELGPRDIHVQSDFDVTVSAPSPVR